MLRVLSSGLMVPVAELTIQGSGSIVSGVGFRFHD